MCCRSRRSIRPCRMLCSECRHCQARQSRHHRNTGAVGQRRSHRFDWSCTLRWSPGCRASSDTCRPPHFPHFPPTPKHHHRYYHSPQHLRIRSWCYPWSCWNTQRGSAPTVKQPRRGRIWQPCLKYRSSCNRAPELATRLATAPHEQPHHCGPRAREDAPYLWGAAQLCCQPKKHLQLFGKATELNCRSKARRGALTCWGAHHGCPPTGAMILICTMHISTQAPDRGATQGLRGPEGGTRILGGGGVRLDTGGAMLTGGTDRLTGGASGSKVSTTRYTPRSSSERTVMPLR